MSTRTARNQSRITWEYLVNDLKATGTIVTKKTIGNALCHEGLKSCSAFKHPLPKKAHVQACLKFANDSEENWVKVLWSNETKSSFLASTQLAVFGGGGGMLPMTLRTPSPPSNMEVETLCFGSVFYAKETGQLHGIKGTIDGAMYCQGHWHWKWVVDGYSSMTMTQYTRPRQQRSGSRRSTLRSWSGKASLQTLIP